MYVLNDSIGMLDHFQHKIRNLATQGGSDAINLPDWASADYDWMLRVRKRMGIPFDREQSEKRKSTLRAVDAKKRRNKDTRRPAQRYIGRVVKQANKSGNTARRSRLVREFCAKMSPPKANGEKDDDDPLGYLNEAVGTAGIHTQFASIKALLEGDDDMMRKLIDQTENELTSGKAKPPKKSDGKPKSNERKRSSSPSSESKRNKKGQSPKGRNKSLSPAAQLLSKCCALANDAKQCIAGDGSCCNRVVAGHIWGTEPHASSFEPSETRMQPGFGLSELRQYSLCYNDMLSSEIREMQEAMHHTIVTYNRIMKQLLANRRETPLTMDRGLSDLDVEHTHLSASLERLYTGQGILKSDASAKKFPGDSIWTSTGKLRAMYQRGGPEGGGADWAKFAAAQTVPVQAMVPNGPTVSALIPSHLIPPADYEATTELDNWPLPDDVYWGGPDRTRRVYSHLLRLQQMRAAPSPQEQVLLAAQNHVSPQTELRFYISVGISRGSAGRKRAQQCQTKFGAAFVAGGPGAGDVEPNHVCLWFEPTLVPRSAGDPLSKLALVSEAECGNIAHSFAAAAAFSATRAPAIACFNGYGHYETIVISDAAWATFCTAHARLLQGPAGERVRQSKKRSKPSSVGNAKQPAQKRRTPRSGNAKQSITKRRSSRSGDAKQPPPKPTPKPQPTPKRRSSRSKKKR